MALHCPFFPKELFDTKNSREHARTYSCVSDIIFVDAKIRKKAFMVVLYSRIPQGTT